MRKKLLAILGMLFSSFCCYAQLSESFSDGDFTNNPAWVGGSSDWMVNSAGQLQSNNSIANSTFYLSTASTKATTAQWEFFAQLAFNTSSANYVDVFLTASASDLTMATTTGYFVRLGGTTDEVSLYRKDAGTITRIIDGTDAILNSSSNSVQVKVVRNAANQWTLSEQNNSAGNIIEGTVTDANYLTSSFFGILVKQSTASFFQQHFFDNILVGDYIPDVIPPQIQSLTATGIHTLDVLFNEPVEQASSETVANFIAGSGIGSPVSAVRDLSNTSLLHLTFATSFPLNTPVVLTVNGVNDLSSNTLINGTANFIYSIPGQYDVVIDELMADPDPQVSLPNLEWIELKNTSSADINLLGWTLGKATGPSGPLPSYLLKPDSTVIVCTSSAVAALSVYGPTIAVTSFPSLNNTGDLVYLRSAAGAIIHSVNYSDSWYQNQLKADGGWSLEMIDTHNPCSGASNWKASVDPAGGTPGRKNSVDGVNPDQQSPELVRAYASDEFNITLVFNEPLDSSLASVASAYNISNGISSASTAIAIGPLFDRVQLQLATALQANTIYTVTASASVTDCSNNAVATKNTARVGLAASTVDSFAIVINEVLFNPTAASNDYVELYNRSSTILNLKNVSIANATDFQHLTTDDYLFFPGDFIVVTDNRDLVLHDYVADNPAAFLEVTMPSYNDDEGDVRVLNEQGNIIDRVAYLDDWQFKLLHDEEGVALERIDYNAPSQNPANWHSAASSVHYGTPTYKNSQFRADAAVQGEIKIDPEVFSPDNDGHDDFATINYSFPAPGYVANITIFDAVGRPVRNLQRNALSGIKGYYRWDGLDDKNQKLPVGIYIIYMEVFNLQGQTKKFKNSIVLARKQ